MRRKGFRLAGAVTKHPPPPLEVRFRPAVCSGWFPVTDNISYGKHYLTLVKNLNAQGRCVTGFGAEMRSGCVVFSAGVYYTVEFDSGV